MTAKKDIHHYARTYALCTTESKDGWAHSGFNRQDVGLQFRKVDGELQIEIDCIEFKGTTERLYRHCFGTVLSVELVAELKSLLDDQYGIGQSFNLDKERQ